MMQKRLIEDLGDLEINIEQIQKSTHAIKSTLSRLLSAQDKSFEVIFMGEEFNFNIPCTQEEYDNQKELRKRLLYLILRECFMDMISGKNESWSYITIFASGVDPLDFQCEKIELKDLYEVTDSNGEVIKSISLNEENYQVSQEMIRAE